MRSIIGKWITDPEDVDAVREYGQVTQEFMPDGRLIYTIHADSTDQVMYLTYRIEGGEIITDQLSDPREERTPFQVTEDGKLILGEPPNESSYIRQFTE